MECFNVPRESGRRRVWKGVQQRRSHICTCVTWKSLQKDCNNLTINFCCYSLPQISFKPNSLQFENSSSFSFSCPFSLRKWGNIFKFFFSFLCPMEHLLYGQVFFTRTNICQEYSRNNTCLSENEGLHTSIAGNLQHWEFNHIGCRNMTDLY